MKDFQEQLGIKVNTKEQKWKRPTSAGLFLTSILAAATVTIMVSIMSSIYAPNSNRGPDFNKVYRQALMQYADIDPRDEFISAAEQDAFDR